MTPMRELGPFIIVVALLVGMSSRAMAAAGPPADAVSPPMPAAPIGDRLLERLRSRIETSDPDAHLSASGDRVHATPSVRRFYEERTFRPIWLDNGRVLPQADSLLAFIGGVGREGLDPEDYHWGRLERLTDRLSSPWASDGERIDLELLLSDAYMILASHLVAGHLDPESIDPEWIATRRELDIPIHMSAAVAAGDIRASLEALLPPQARYARLREALARYRRLATRGGWPGVPSGPTLHPGDVDDRVPALRERLLATGDLAPDENGDGGPVAADDSTGGAAGLFDDALAGAVRRFQARHGLEVDGIVGAATLSALDVPVADRIRQLIVNLERWRWLPQSLGERHIEVNIADFNLDVVEAGYAVASMRVIVGRSYRRTPVFTGRMTYLVLNPSWEVPPRLAVQDILPRIRKEPAYLSDNGFTVLKGWGGSEQVIDAGTVDWTRVPAASFPYRFRQKPGPKNALGRIKFMFPNRFDVYLHDTSSPELFRKTTRSLSSGCIRVADPIGLAELLLAPDPRWSRAAILAAIDSGEERTVRLSGPVPVHLLYWTAWVTEDGTVHFRTDLYGRDQLVLSALETRPPAPGFETGTAAP